MDYYITETSRVELCDLILTFFNTNEERLQSDHRQGSGDCKSFNRLLTGLNQIEYKSEAQREPNKFGSSFKP